jgi:hypothetical protein
MYKLGAADPEAFATASGQLPGLHSDRFAPAAEPTLRTGVLTMTAAIREALGAEFPWWLDPLLDELRAD